MLYSCIHHLFLLLLLFCCFCDMTDIDSMLPVDHQPTILDPENPENYNDDENDENYDSKSNDSDSDEPIEVPQHFKCPISQCIMLDPITVPCCCRSYSRQALEVMFEKRKTCPMCQVELKDYNPSTAPRQSHYKILLMLLLENIMEN